MFQWLTMSRLGELCDALGLHPADLFDALNGAAK